MRLTKDTIEKESRMRLFFEDECPRIGSGWRTIDIKVGRKWITFQDSANGTKAKMAMDEAFPIINGSIRRSSR